MDFKDIIQAEILSKRKIYDEKTGKKKYIRRGEVEGNEEPAACGKGVKCEESSECSKCGECSGDEHLDSPKNEHTDNHANSHKRHKGQEQHKLDVAVIKTTVTSSPVEVTADTPSATAIVDTSPSRKFDEALLIGVMETEPICAEDIRNDPSKLRTLISLFLRRLIREQGAVLAQRLPSNKNSREGRLATTVYQQCQDHLRPLFKHLRKDLLPADVLYSLAKICGFMQQREYVKANDMYLKLAIGNAPWPIGVTAVGIHERCAQEKIKSNQVARK